MACNALTAHLMTQLRAIRRSAPDDDEEENADEVEKA
jgi:hypothetical protein